MVIRRPSSAPDRRAASTMRLIRRPAPTLWQTQVGPRLGAGRHGVGLGKGWQAYLRVRSPIFYGIPMGGGSAGSWAALDPATGAILWQTADPNGAMALSADGGGRTGWCMRLRWPVRRPRDDDAGIERRQRRYALELRGRSVRERRRHDRGRRRVLGLRVRRTSAFRARPAATTQFYAFSKNGEVTAVRWLGRSVAPAPRIFSPAGSATFRRSLRKTHVLKRTLPGKPAVRDSHRRPDDGRRSSARRPRTLRKRSRRRKARRCDAQRRTWSRRVYT